MPNHVRHSLTFADERSANLCAQLAGEINESGRVVPSMKVLMPESLLSPPQFLWPPDNGKWYERHCDVYGSKWADYDIEFCNEEGARYLAFDSAWAFSSAYVTALAAAGVAFEGAVLDEGFGFAYEFGASDGVYACSECDPKDAYYIIYGVVYEDEDEEEPE